MGHPTHTTTAAAALLSATLLAGCSTSSHAAAPASPVPSTVQPATTTRPTAAQAAAQQSSGIIPQPPSATGWDTGTPTAPTGSSSLPLTQTAQSQAVALATKAMRLFARRTVTADQWWHDLSPLLTPQAQQAYLDTDPRNVAPTRLTGTGRLTPASLPEAARVSIDTDAGVYLVILTRDNDHAPWLVDRISPPEAVAEGA